MPTATEDMQADPLERRRDLKDQLDGVDAGDLAEVVFQDTSPPKRRVQMYHVVSGEPVYVPRKLAEKAMEKRLLDGRYMFTTDPAKAPAYKMGSVKCFLHEESVERESGILDEVGLGGITCPAAGLASLYSKRIHAQHRHGQQWDAYQEFIKEQKEAKAEERQQAQIDATLALASRASEAEAAAKKTKKEPATAE